jgi:hypothetical protein
VLLEVLLGGSDELDGGKLEAEAKSQLEALTVSSKKPTYPRFSKRETMGPMRPRCIVC